MIKKEKMGENMRENMRKSNNNNMLIASLAVFRELYDSEKDIYGVVAVFISDVINDNSLKTFSLTEITELVNKTYELKIPSAVIRASVKRLSEYVEKNDSIYYVNEKFFQKMTISKKSKSASKLKENTENSYIKIFDDLKKYVELKCDFKLNDHSIEKLTHSFCSFLLDDTNGNDYIEYITSFVISNEKMKRLLVN